MTLVECGVSQCMKWGRGDSSGVWGVPVYEVGER